MHPAAHQRKVRLILAGLLVAQLADASTFVVGVHRFGIHAEANGWARALYSVGGFDAVLGMKGIAIVLALSIIVLAAYRYPRLVIPTGAAGTSLGLFGAVSNTLSTVLVAYGQ